MELKKAGIQTGAKKLNFANQGQCSFRHLYICIQKKVNSAQQFRMCFRLCVHMSAICFVCVYLLLFACVNQLLTIYSKVYFNFWFVITYLAGFHHLSSTWSHQHYSMTTALYQA